jgi:hypothetical protein
MQRVDSAVWDSFVAEASGLALYAKRTPSGSWGTVCALLAESENPEAEPVDWESDDGVLRVTIRAMRDVSGRRDQMISDAIGWLLSAGEAQDRQALVSLTYRLGPSELLLGFVADPPMSSANDERLEEIVRLAAETDGLLFNGARFRAANGEDLAWAAPQRATGRGRSRLRLRRPRN